MRLARFCASRRGVTNALQFPLPTRFAAEFLVRRRVVHEHLLRRVPLQLSADAVTDVAEVADARGAVPDLRRADRLLAALDALQPVLLVVGAGVDAFLLLAERFLEDRIRQRTDAAAADEDDALGALEHAVGADVLAVLALLELVVNHYHAGGVDEPQPATALGVFRWDHFA